MSCIEMKQNYSIPTNCNADHTSTGEIIETGLKPNS